MAKKKAAARREHPKRKATKPGKAPRRTARAVLLPGMEQVRNARLDHLCADIGDARDQMNISRTLEKEAVAGALDVMHRGNLSIYKAAGVELARVPGSERLRVRLVKDQGSAEVEAGATRSENADAEHDEG